VGEFLVLLATFKASFWITLLAATTLVIGAAYTLWMVKRVFFGPIVHKSVAELKPIKALDWFTYAILAAVILIIGIYPEPVVRVFHASVNHLLTLALAHKV
jgi:NADH-quinone oxidoreductase subunit M